MARFGVARWGAVGYGKVWCVTVRYGEAFKKREVI